MAFLSLWLFGWCVSINSNGRSFLPVLFLNMEPYKSFGLDSRTRVQPTWKKNSDFDFSITLKLFYSCSTDFENEIETE